MGYGAYHPFPKRFGGGRNALEVRHRALNAARGSAYDPQPGTAVWIENMAYARAITFDGDGALDRLKNQADPTRTTSMLPRWERIFGIVPAPGMPEPARRRELTMRWARFGVPGSKAAYVAALKAYIPNYIVDVEFISLANAVVHVPDGTYPWGTVVSGATWTSTVSHVLVRLQKPATASEADFYNAAARIYPVLDPLLPAWATLDWYRAPLSTPIVVIGGPSAGGFYLDDDHNLDSNVFSE